VVKGYGWVLVMADEEVSVIESYSVQADEDFMGARSRLLDLIDL